MHVSLKEKCKLSRDRVFRACKSLDAARGQQLPTEGGGGLWWQLGADEVAAILSLEGNRGGEGEKTRHNDQGWCLGWGIDGDIGSGLG